MWPSHAQNRPTPGREGARQPDGEKVLRVRLTRSATISLLHSTTMFVSPRLLTPQTQRAPPCRSRFKKFVRERAAKLRRPKRKAHYEDLGAGESQCPRCDKGLHRKCLRLKHCTAKERSPAGINKRNQGESSLHARTRSPVSAPANVCSLASMGDLICAYMLTSALVGVLRACQEEGYQGRRQACQGSFSYWCRFMDAQIALRRSRRLWWWWWVRWR